MPSGEISSCDIELSLRSDYTERFRSFLCRIDMIPKGSYLLIGDERFEIGNIEGLALYLNGTELSEEVYLNSDINELIGLLDIAMENVGKRMSYWEGNRINLKLEVIVSRNWVSQGVQFEKIRNVFA